MRTFSLAVLIAMLLAIPVAAQKAEAVSVKIGRQKVVGSNGISMKFESVIEDSRCPADVNCIWAGNAKIRIHLSKNGRKLTAELDTMGNNTAVTFYGYSIKLVGLTPEPRSNVRIDRNGYMAKLEFVKLSR